MAGANYYDSGAADLDMDPADTAKMVLAIFGGTKVIDILAYPYFEIMLGAMVALALAALWDVLGGRYAVGLVRRWLRDYVATGFRIFCRILRRWGQER